MYAFISYACSFPDNFIALVDSYSTMNSGVKNFILVQLVLFELGFKGDKSGIRLDSGDLALFASESKKLFKEAGEKFGFDFSHVKVVASNDINEDVLRKLIDKKH